MSTGALETQPVDHLFEPDHRAGGGREHLPSSSVVPASRGWRTMIGISRSFSPVGAGARAVSGEEQRVGHVGAGHPGDLGALVGKDRAQHQLALASRAAGCQMLSEAACIRSMASAPSARSTSGSGPEKRAWIGLVPAGPKTMRATRISPPSSAAAPKASRSSRRAGI
ncbi:MAG: hypothetical protein R3D59_12505 [Paracoccaceae bacterium]